MIYLTNINLNQNELQNAVIQPLATAPANPKLGQIYCNSSTSKIMWYNGSAWKTIGVVVENSDTNGSIIVDGVEMTIYTLPVASSTTLGGIKVGAGLSVDSNGVLSANGGGTADAIEWDNVLNKPTKLSDFINDESFIDNTVNNLTNYYLKSETYTQTEVNNLIGQIKTIQIVKVDTLPDTGESNKIYLVPKTTSETNNSYFEYIWVESTSKFEKIGDTEIDLSNYLQKNGDGSNLTTAFTTASARELPISGETIAVIVGKVTKYLTDLKTVAFTGSYNDLTDKLEVRSTTATLAAGETAKTVSITGSIINAFVTSATTNELISCDMDITTSSVTVSLASAYSSNLTITVWYKN